MGFLDKLNVKAITDAVNTGVQAAKEGITNIKLDEAIQGAMDAAAAGTAMVGEAIGSVLPKSDEDTTDAGYKEFVSLLWCLAYVDGEISPDERAMLAEISKTLDEGYEEYAEQIEQDCIARLQEASADFGVAHAAKHEAQRIIDTMDISPTGAKLLCWNLLAIANSDGLEESELDFIRFVSAKSGLDPAVFQELKNYSDAIVEIEKARADLKSSNRLYAEVEPLDNEFAQREQVILEAAQMLVSDN